MMDVTQREAAELDFRAMGQHILNTTMDLSQRTNRELLQPISQWLDDPDFWQRHAVVIEQTTSWAEYKRQQRDARERINRDQQAEALRRYWAAVKHKKALLQEVAHIIPKRTRNKPQHPEPHTEQTDQGWLTAALGPFSHSAQHARQTARDFRTARELPLSLALPWRTLLRTELSAQRRFVDLPTIHPDEPKKDTVAKFCHLLHMEQDGEVDLEQDAEGDITIRPRTRIEENTITITDQAGNELRLEWDALSDPQREKVLRDAREHRIICKEG